jgi:glucose/arabinose dehydrogenase
MIDVSEILAYCGRPLQPNQINVASGMRNPTALAFHPDTGELWALVQERDGLGDNLPSDFLIRVQQTRFLWLVLCQYRQATRCPASHSWHPTSSKRRSHSTCCLPRTPRYSIWCFTTGTSSRPGYKGSLFFALKGSWNRSVPTGYEVVRVPFKDGRPEGWYENFATGFWASGEQGAEVSGRPSALAVAKHGSLLVADDTGGTIWRIF